MGTGPAQRWITLLDGQQLRLLRRYHGLTQQELAAKAGISCATVTRLERASPLACRRPHPVPLADALGIEPAALMARPRPPGARARNRAIAGRVAQPGHITSMLTRAIRVITAADRDVTRHVVVFVAEKRGRRGRPGNLRADPAGAGLRRIPVPRLIPGHSAPPRGGCSRGDDHMIEQAYDRDSVRQYVEAVRGVLGSDQLREATAAAAQPLPGPGDPPAKVSAALPPPGDAEPSSGGAVSTVVPYLSRDPAVSLMQSALDGALREQGVADRAPLDRSLWATIVHTAEEMLHPGDFSPEDPDWVIKIAGSMLGHLAKGNHPFNPRPAAHAISDSARLVVVGDWGTGLPRARAVASYMADEVADALAHGREAHVIHLGDVYYSGLPSEVQRHVLACWPVTAGQAQAGVTSWSLNGNHDMYSGGFGYFQTLLADPRFAGPALRRRRGDQLLPAHLTVVGLRGPGHVLERGRPVQGGYRGAPGPAGGFRRGHSQGLRTGNWSC